MQCDLSHIVIIHDLVVRFLQSLGSAPVEARLFFDYSSERESERLSSKSYNWMLGILGSKVYVEEFWDLLRL